MMCDDGGHCSVLNALDDRGCVQKLSLLYGHAGYDAGEISGSADRAGG